MVVELRKRKAPAAQPGPVKKKAATAKSTKKVPKAEKATEEVKSKDTTTSKAAVPKVGDVISLEGFGGELQTQDGESTALQSLIASSKAGVVLFTYPRASTPGCTKQACMFRDGYEHLTSTGLAIYGLSTDSPKANTTFKTKQNLPYPLLCDPNATLIGSLGLKKSPKGTVRGVCVIDKTGKVLLLEPGSPAGTVEAVEKIVRENSVKNGDSEDKKEDPKEREDEKKE
ncbi:disrupter of telomere silencing protein Dot5, putative [Talaromyces stipitatus ATCC 10500]|uniref:thioredoxin-dependent peroxiredoxin n=1 Tax=Talaromyces stipitatus (strain ATCC 10500 / CBS 375.48 / QM 6759 / NRRL 1006) TaxID=441959 RepID=B8LTP8_TALSN|nr:disrupter of telomere silencing protein Dot5, putative [Talaromyces stipitatus ATCC 10500]EED23640.1 disrupter of telomere silencing protein Dot5, putative [Talaromyces stipitatus ATCC 10500]